MTASHARQRRGLTTSPTRLTATLLPLVGLTAFSAAARAATGAGNGSWVGVALLALPLAVAMGLLVSAVTTRWRQSLQGDPLVTAAELSAFASAAVVAVALSCAAQSLLVAPALGIRGAGSSAFSAVASLPVALAGALALRLVAAAGARVATLTRAHLWRALAAVTTVVLSVGTFSSAPFVALTPAGAASAVGPCPSNVPMKTFDAQSINIDIPLNRFGDHDPNGRMYVLNNKLDDVRAEEKTQKVAIGLRDDAIQPLVIRANQGDCVTINYTNNADGGDFGLHIDGLAYDVAAAGNNIGRNPGSTPKKGESRTYTFYVPNDDSLEGAHYLHPGPGFRAFVHHGLFGSLVVEPPGSTYLDPNAVDEAHSKPLESGWEATVRPAGHKEFRENVQLYHEIGDEKNDPSNQPLTRTGAQVAFIDPHSDAYRPNTRAINYRSESFMNRLDAAPEQEAHGYGSYTFGDPATPMPRGYQADPTKFRILNVGSEMFHVFHMHGGGIRWRFNPVADPTFNYEDTGLNKHPVQASSSTRLDSQAFGPGESYNLEIEGGAGGVQQGAGDFLFHCHIAEHYVAGMWSFWRVYNTRQLDFAPLADRTDPPSPVDSSALIGKTFGGQTITAENLDDWIKPQLPPAGVRKDTNDASVWDWTRNAEHPQQYLGEPEDTSSWADYNNTVAGHPTALPGDSFVGDRPVLLFDPTSGRPAYPMMRPHLGMRPPFAGNGHSGAPYLGEMGGKKVDSGGSTNPWAMRDDAICPKDDSSGNPTSLRRFNVVAIEGAVKVTPKDTDPAGQVFVLAHDKEDVLNGDKPFQPLALRANVGDCVAVTLTSELTDANSASHFSQVNMHIHHVQFDTQASDGVITGMSYEQAVRPYKVEDPSLTSDASAGSQTLHLSDVSKFQVGVAIGVGLGTEGAPASGTVNSASSGSGPEIRTITGIDKAAGTVTIDAPLGIEHEAGQWAGTEFTQYRWFPDVDLDNIFWHDHVDGIHTWAHGLVGQLIVEPKDSTYHDPKTGAQVDSGTIVDIHTDNALAPAAGVKGSFRELALWEMDKGFGATQDSMFNLRAEPLADRLGDPAQRFSSYAHGDPITPLPRAYAGDPLVIRTINVGPSVDTLGIDGHQFLNENRYTDAAGKLEGTPVDTLHYGISEKYTLILQGGAGGPQHAAGDYLYFNGINRRMADGAWGIIRVLPGRVTDQPSDPNYLRPLPGTGPGSASPLPTTTGGAPPEATSADDPCPTGATPHAFNITAVRVKAADNNSTRYAYVPSYLAAGATAGSITPRPLVMHVTQGECITVKVTNSTDLASVGFHLRGLENDVASAGVNVGWNPNSTIALGTSRTYHYYVDSEKAGGGIIADLAGDIGAVGAGAGKRGLYGAFTVAPHGSTFSDPETGVLTDLGEAVDVHVPGHKDYRDFSLLLADDEKQLGASFMPYPSEAEKPNGVLVNYRQAPRDDIRGDAFSSAAFGDPATPILQAYAGDPMVVHTFVTPGSEQPHAFNMGGLSFPGEKSITHSNLTDTRGIGPWESAQISPLGGAGGTGHAPGDYFYGDLRRAFTRAGMWGLQRVLPQPTTCPDPGGSHLMCLDTAPSSPGVTFSPTPTVTNKDHLSIGFTSTDPDASFQCSLAQGGEDEFAPCTSPFLAKDLRDGTATLRVRPTSHDGWEGLEGSVSFRVDRAAPTVSASPPGGHYASAQKVTLTASEPGEIRYTLDGRDPGPDSSAYNGPITVDHSAELRFAATDPAGNPSPVGQASYAISTTGGGGAAVPGGGSSAQLPPHRPPGVRDTTAPRVDKAPTVNLTGGRVTRSGRVPVTVSWAVSDASGVSDYQLWRRTDAGREVAVRMPSTTRRQLTTTLAAGHRYTFTLRAWDGAGNASRKVPGKTATIGLRQESSASVSYSGRWSTQSGAGFSAGQARVSSHTGDAATITVPAGNRVGLVLATGPDSGRVRVLVNGEKLSAVTLDLYSPWSGRRYVTWKTTAASNTVRLVVLGQSPRSDGRVDLDAVVLLRR